jgi:hypothetical protein
MSTGESLMAENKECHHVMPSGLRCKSPVMRATAFCYFHGRPVRPARPLRPLETRIEMPPLPGHDGIPGAINQVVQALAANRISSRRAAILLQGIQMASGNALPGSAGFGFPLDSMFPQNEQPPPHRVKE